MSCCVDNVKLGFLEVLEVAIKLSNLATEGGKRMRAFVNGFVGGPVGYLRFEKGKMNGARFMKINHLGGGSEAVYH